MNMETNIESFLAAVRKAKRARVVRMLRGKMETAMRKARIGYDAQDEALREFDRNIPKGLPY